MFQTKRWSEAIRPKGAVAIARHRHAGSVGADDLKATPVAATVRLGHLIFQTKRWNEVILMADLKAQSPSLAITMRVPFGRTTSRRLGFEARGTSALRFGF